jgi:quinone-modifying oxidoreductase subunit QmoC
MAEALQLKPDRKFVDEVIAAGGGDLKKCFQCATCSVACELSNGPSPFPRKEMIWAQWGMKDRLLNDPDVWLCHQCNDCSMRCPRGARPGDVLAALRQKSIEHHSFPSFMGRLVNSARAMPVMLVLIPALLLGLAVVARDSIAETFGLADPHSAFYAEFFPHWLLIGFFTTLTLLTFLGLIVGLVRFWKGMKEADEARGVGEPATGFVPSLVKALGAVFTHGRFGKCKDQAQRRNTHLMAFYGFLALFVVTVWATFDLYLFPVLGMESLYPFDLSHPMKMLANVGGIILVVGTGKAILDRLNAPADGKHRSTSFDWIFVWLLFLVGVTGFVTEILRFTVTPETMGAMEYSAYSVYFVHLVLVFGLLVYLPYSKFAHMWYRILAMAYAEHTGRTNGARSVAEVAAGRA